MNRELLKRRSAARITSCPTRSGGN